MSTGLHTSRLSTQAQRKQTRVPVRKTTHMPSAKQSEGGGRSYGYAGMSDERLAKIVVVDPSQRTTTSNGSHGTLSSNTESSSGPNVTLGRDGSFVSVDVDGKPLLQGSTGAHAVVRMQHRWDEQHTLYILVEATEPLNVTPFEETIRELNQRQINVNIRLTGPVIPAEWHRQEAKPSGREYKTPLAVKSSASSQTRHEALSLMQSGSKVAAQSQVQRANSFTLTPSALEQIVTPRLTGFVPLTFVKAFGESVAVGLGVVALTGVLFGMSPLAGLAVTSLLLGSSFLNAYQQRREEVEASGYDVTIPQSAVEALGEVVGLTQLLEGISGLRMGTLEPLNPEQRSEELGEGLGGLVVALKASRAFKIGYELGQSHPLVLSPALPKAAPEVVPEAAPEAVPEAAPEVVPEAAPKVAPEPAPEVAVEAEPEVHLLPEESASVDRVAGDTVSDRPIEPLQTEAAAEPELAKPVETVDTPESTRPEQPEGLKSSEVLPQAELESILRKKIGTRADSLSPSEIRLARLLLEIGDGALVDLYPRVARFPGGFTEVAYHLENQPEAEALIRRWHLSAMEELIKTYGNLMQAQKALEQGVPTPTRNWSRLSSEVNESQQSPDPTFEWNSLRQPGNSPGLSPGEPRVKDSSTWDRYHRIDTTERGTEAFAYIESDGTLSIDLRTVSEAGNRSGVLRGAEEYARILKHFKGRIRGISGNWQFGTNIKMFNEAIAAGKSLEEAALLTWSGQRAAENGYTSVKILNCEPPGMTGPYTHVKVVFFRPGTSGY